jgi:DNA-binding transcriptional MerR regulator
MRVGEVAARAGVNVETLRYYERRGLLPAPDRQPSGHRRYDEGTVRLLRAIKEAQAVGFTLNEVAEYLRAARRAQSPSEALRIRMAAKIDEIDGRIAGLRRMRDELARVVGCACASLDHCTCGAAYLALGGRPPSTPPELLHVTNGDSAANTLRQTALGGAVLSWQDALHEGPVPGGPRATVLGARARFLSECGWGSRSALLAAFERRDRIYLDALRDGRRVVLWFEHDLYDQLQLLDALALAHEAGVAPDLIVIGAFPGKRRFTGLGELSASELETLWPSRTVASADVLATAGAIWQAFRADEPTALAEWAACQAPELPFVTSALQRLLEELPSAANGLSATERRALEAIAQGAGTPPAVTVASQREEPAPFLGDTWFYRTLAGLASGDGRLVETEEGDPLPAPPPLGDAQRFSRLRLRLSGEGDAVLRGQADRVALLGLDRWLGGTHLTPEAQWRWDARGRQVRRLG